MLNIDRLISFLRPTAIVLGLTLIAGNIDCRACTAAVVTGKATSDGRPLLWKHRDTDYLPNHVAHVKGERFDFIADVNSENFDTAREAWIGVNDAGFAIMNTQSYNLVKIKPGEERGEANGRMIYRALEMCETLEDFEHFLDTIAKPSLIEANFGVIDAKGGAAIYEVDYYGYTKFDANDPEVAPEGYIARTNFSVSGKHGKGSGHVRFLEADDVLKAKAREKGITPQFIYNDLSRSFHNPVIGVDLRDGRHNKPHGSGWFVDEDFIPRNITSCSVVVQGVKEGENPQTDVMWTLLGYPPTGVAIPLWIPGEGQTLPEIVSYDPQLKCAPVSAWSLGLADSVFSLNKGNGTKKYLHWEKLYNNEGDGYMQKLVPVENAVFEISEPLAGQWFEAGKVDLKKQAELYGKISEMVTEGFEQTKEQKH